METKRPISIFKKDVISTIVRPDFLDNTNSFSTEEISWRHTFNTLKLFSDGINTNILNESKIKYICDFINAEIEELSKSVDSKQLLMCWLYIGELVEDWVQMALELEEYESASNLMKILEKACND